MRRGVWEDDEEAGGGCAGEASGVGEAFSDQLSALWKGSLGRCSGVRCSERSDRRSAVEGGPGRPSPIPHSPIRRIVFALLRRSMGETKSQPLIEDRKGEPGFHATRGRRAWRISLHSVAPFNRWLHSIGERLRARKAFVKADWLAGRKRSGSQTDQRLLHREVTDSSAPLFFFWLP